MRALGRDLAGRLRPLERETSPFAGGVRQRHVTWVTPKLVAQVAFHERCAVEVLLSPELARVVHHDRAVGLAQGPHGVRPDVPGATGDEDGHDAAMLPTTGREPTGPVTTRTATATASL